MNFFRGLRIALPLSLALCGVIGIGVYKAAGQEADKILVPLTAVEQQSILVMCEAAKYGYRANFEAFCPILKTRFEEAARPKPKPDEK